MAPPAYIFVVRHGNRLDAADKQWHVSSPTPYDPPLTYTGWTQSRTVGTKIADILKERALDYEAAQTPDGPRKKKRFRVVIHSSPFLRCIQTAVAVSAGLSSRPSVIANAHRNLSASQMAQEAGPVDSKSSSPRKPRRTTISIGPKVVLRIDAFLGEWMEPKYFDHITPPPGSVMMLASAKASLLKAEDYNNYPHFQHRLHSNSTTSAAQPPTGHLWGGTGLKPSPLAALSTTTDEVDTTSNSAFDGLDRLGRTLPRTSSRGSNMSEMTQSSRSASVAAAAIPAEIGAYDPPVPAFSIHKHAPIPPGYVNHAKDHCVVVDYQWDSMREPYSWGEGGELPEEWFDMHKRFRKGLQSMMDWYFATKNPTSAVTTEYIKPGASGLLDTGSGPDEDEDDDVETVLIIVSHGAGCNAMIGAITHQPVLMDVPISSLTTAILNKDKGKESETNGSASAPNGNPPSSSTKSSSSNGNGSLPLHQTYSVKVFASTDHLRPSTPTPSSSRSSSVANAFGHRSRNSNSFSMPRAGIGGGPISNSTSTDGHINRSSSANASSLGSLGSIRKGLLRDSAVATAKQQQQALPRSGGSMAAALSGALSEASFTPSGLSRTPSVGLWSPATSAKNQGSDEDEECIEDDEDAEMMLDFAHDKQAAAAEAAARAAAAASEGNGRAVGSSSNATRKKADSAEDVLRDGHLSPSKRRWTVNERP